LAYKRRICSALGLTVWYWAHSPIGALEPSSLGGRTHSPAAWAASAASSMFIVPSFTRALLFAGWVQTHARALRGERRCSRPAAPATIRAAKGPPCNYHRRDRAR